MIVIFLSGYENRYRANILNTLGLPKGVANAYEYSTRDEQPNVGKENLEKLGAASAGTPVLFVYIDRFAKGGYRYIPVREGALLHSSAADRVRVTVAMGDHVTCRDEDGFQKTLAAALEGRRMPALAATGPNEKNDGEYVVVDVDTSGVAYEKVGVDAWSDVARRLSMTTAMKSTTVRAVVFMCLTVHHASEAGELVEVEGGGETKGKLLLFEGTNYKLRIRYLFPIVGINSGASHRISVTLGPALAAGGPSEVPVGAAERTEEFAFKAATRQNEPDSFLTIEAGATSSLQGPPVEILAPTLSVRVRLKTRSVVVLTYYLFLVVYILGMVARAVVAGHDFLSAFLAEALVGLALFGLFRLFGMKPI